MRFRWLASVGLAMLMAACDDGQRHAAQAPPAAPPAVGIVTVAAKDVSRAYEFIGRVQAVEKVELRARIEGFLVERHFTEGQTVAEGDLLFTIEQPPFQAKVDQARADLAAARAKLANAEVQFQRAATLSRTRDIPEATVDERRALRDTAAAEVQQAEAALRAAEINLGYTLIRAPVRGVIGRATVTVGNFVGPASGPLATIVSLDPIYLTFPVSQRQLLEAQRHAVGKAGAIAVRARLPDGSLYDQPGRIDFIDNQVDEATDSVPVRAMFPNPERLLKDGQIARAVVEVADPDPRLTVPMAAVVIDQAGPSVLVVGADGKVEQRRVRLGPEQGPEVVVVQGLKEGEQVIVDGLQKVRPGQTVAASPAAVAGS
jgi:membrane fusion protein (multidrug efflux system)